jgi:uncharacterized membrane protein AbrB (regulator of aidB expression)
VGRWILVIVVYMLLYTGVEEGLWPVITNFHHMDWKVPGVVDGIVGSVLAPFVAGILIGGTLRQEFSGSPWPVLMAPLVVIAVLGYASSSFYPPWWNEALARLAGGAVQGAFAWCGWFLYRRLSGRRSRFVQS